LATIKGLAEKAGEHACRIAATIAFVENPHLRTIGREHYAGAVTLVQHYLHEALCVMSAAGIDPKIARARELLNWLHTQRITRICPQSVIGRKIPERTTSVGRPLTGTANPGGAP
jgi:hypothetical protein